eukprot:10137_3
MSRREFQHSRNPEHISQKPGKPPIPSRGISDCVLVSKAQSMTQRFLDEEDCGRLRSQNPCHRQYGCIRGNTSGLTFVHFVASFCQLLSYLMGLCFISKLFCTNRKHGRCEASQMIHFVCFPSSVHVAKICAAWGGFLQKVLSNSLCRFAVHVQVLLVSGLIKEFNLIFIETVSHGAKRDICRESTTGGNKDGVETVFISLVQNVEYLELFAI